MIIIASCGHHSDDERIYYKQINTLKKNSIPINYFTYNKSNSELDDKKINHHHFNSNKYSQSQYKKELLQFIQNNNPMVLHIHDLELLPIVRKIKSHNKNIKIIYDIHEDLVSMWDALSKYSGISKQIINTVLSKFELYHLKYIDCFIIANKFAEKKRYENFGPVHLIQNFPIKNDILDKTDINAPYKLIYHGQLDYNRGITTLIDAFNDLSLQYNQLELKIIGKSRTRDFEKIVKTKIKKNGKIKLIAPIPHNNIWDILFESHIGIIPFHDMLIFEKNTPTKLFEFMTTNCGIISSYLEPIYDVAPNSISFSKAGDKNSLLNAMEFYLKNIDIYKKHIVHNKKLIDEKFNWDCESKEILNIYEHLIL